MFYNNNRYIPEWRLRLVHLAAKLAGLTIHVHGMPYGSSSKKYEFKCESGLPENWGIGIGDRVEGLISVDTDGDGRISGIR